jgi:NADPH:quinone reductase-like Zn-dependent oxidoreductase
MKAAVHTRYGPPEVVRISDVDKPTARDNELLVKVHATTVNRTDCGYRAAKPFILRLFSGLFRPRVTVLGNEFAGEVEAVGSDVMSFEVGDRVFGYTEGPFGAHAEYMTIREDGWLATMPTNVTYEQAAPVPRVRTMPSRSSEGQRSRAGSTSSSTAQPGPSARRPSSC